MLSPEPVAGSPGPTGAGFTIRTGGAMLMNFGTSDERLNASVLNLAHLVERHLTEFRRVLRQTKKLELLEQLEAAIEVWHSTAFDVIHDANRLARAH
jgi:hypothetical protein